MAGEPNGVMTTDAAISDDVTKTDNESMTSPVHAEMSANDSVHSTPITVTSETPTTSMSTTRHVMGN